MIALADPDLGSMIWGACKDCFREMNLSLDSGKADWYIGRAEVS